MPGTVECPLRLPLTLRDESTSLLSRPSRLLLFRLRFLPELPRRSLRAGDEVEPEKALNDESTIVAGEEEEEEEEEAAAGDGVMGSPFPAELPPFILPASTMVATSAVSADDATKPSCGRGPDGFSITHCVKSVIGL